MERFWGRIGSPSPLEPGVSAITQSPPEMEENWWPNQMALDKLRPGD
jgi:hypothetical protein